MNKMKKFRFNMVEIMLAVVILSVGMASVFVLFPAGLSNHRSAMAENSIADLAELVFSKIRAESALSVYTDGFRSDVLASFPLRSELENTSNEIKDPTTSWDNGLDGDDPWTLHKDSNGLYMVRQVSGPKGNHYVDFSAVVAVYKEDGSDFGKELFVPIRWGEEENYNSLSDKGSSGSDPGNVRKLEFENFILPLVMEISYPADLPYAEREKSYFRFEIYNERFELKI